MWHSHRYTARITAAKEKAHQYCVNQCLMGFFC
ncbi:zinc-finger domain-containing protein [Yersinia rohdei]